MWWAMRRQRASCNTSALGFCVDIIYTYIGYIFTKNHHSLAMASDTSSMRMNTRARDKTGRLTGLASSN